VLYHGDDAVEFHELPVGEATLSRIALRQQWAYWT